MSGTLNSGDVFEISTNRGTAYFQYVLRKSQWGALIRVLPGVYSEAPQLESLAQEEQMFYTFFPLTAAIKKKLVRFCGNFAIPEFASRFPVFKAAGMRDREGKVLDWWIWDGESEYQVDHLTEEQKKYPVQEVLNDTMLIQLIDEDWTPEKDF